MNSEPIHMVRLRASLPLLLRLGAARGLPLTKVDRGYMGHVLLTELFGDASPVPFAMTGEDMDGMTLLGYSPETADELRERASAFAPPEAHSVVDWESCCSKPMPAAWREGQRMAFETRTCPVVRVTSNNPSFEKNHAEVDAFLAACAQAPEEQVRREEVYGQWLKDQMARHGEVDVEAVRITRWEIAQLFRRRRAQGRRPGRSLPRPAVEMKGVLTVTSSDAMNRLLRRGVGRHRAFGFGMILLRSN